MSIAPWNTAVGASVPKARNPLERANEDMPRKAIDIHHARLTIQEAAVDLPNSVDIRKPRQSAEVYCLIILSKYSFHIAFATSGANLS